MLTDVPVISQAELMSLYTYGVESGKNILVFGPSGSGKTEMAFQVAKAMDCNLIYINLSVLERTDFQGLPVLSPDKKSVAYATPEFLPFADTRSRDLTVVSTYLKDYLKYKNLNDDDIDQEIERLAEKNVFNQRVSYLKSNIGLVKGLEINFQGGRGLSHLLSSQIMAEKLDEISDKPIIFLFDELDKSLNEVSNVLLEFLQFRSVNGRKLNIKSCFLTGNLPDEYANSGHVSHAITKRCMTYRLDIDFNQWREWAFKNGINDEIIGFLNANREYLYKKPIDNDPTAYALPSPRTWKNASDALWMINKSESSRGLSSDGVDLFKSRIVAGNVGESATVVFNNWVKHYRRLDPEINALLEKGKYPNKNNMDTQELFLCALSACGKIYSNLKDNNEEKITKYTKHVYAWMRDELPEDIVLSASRMSFGGEPGFDNLTKYKLTEIPEFAEVLIKLHDKLNVNFEKM